MGQPYSLFMGCGQPEPGEPLWTAEDRAVALAWQQYQDGLCPCCGVPRELAWSEEHQFDWQGEVRQCHVGAARTKAMKAFTNVGPNVDVDTDGVMPVAYRRDDV